MISSGTLGTVAPVNVQCCAVSISPRVNGIALSREGERA